jgi:hypothetical protein
MTGISGGHILDPVALLVSASDPAPDPAPPEPDTIEPMEPPTFTAPTHQYGTEPPPPPAGCPAGHASPEGAHFCPQCGTPLHAAEEPAYPVADFYKQAAGMPPAPDPAVADRLRQGPLQEVRLSRDPSVPIPMQFTMEQPLPDELLTPEQRAERDRQHVQAMAAGRRDPGIPGYIPAQTPESVLVHMVEDGLSFAGIVWMRGQEIQIDVGSERWEQAKQWILLDDAGQMARYGKVFFRPGPWPGVRTYQAARFEALGPVGQNGAPVFGPSRQELQQADLMEQARRRGVPAMPRG